jgi:Tfp pilus assembly protein PilX
MENNNLNARNLKDYPAVLNQFSSLKNEDGYFLILATMMILALLTIFGVAASRTANTEIAVAANELVYQQNFYMAEGAAMEAVDRLANADDMEDDPPAWLDLTPGAMHEGNVDSYWDVAGIANDLDETGNTRFIAGIENVAQGSSLDMDKPKAYIIGIYGRCKKNGVSMIKVGYISTY